MFMFKKYQSWTTVVTLASHVINASYFLIIIIIIYLKSYFIALFIIFIALLGVLLAICISIIAFKKTLCVKKFFKKFNLFNCKLQTADNEIIPQRVRSVNNEYITNENNYYSVIWNKVKIFIHSIIIFFN